MNAHSVANTRRQQFPSSTSLDLIHILRKGPSFTEARDSKFPFQKLAVLLILVFSSINFYLTGDFFLRRRSEYGEDSQA